MKKFTGLMIIVVMVLFSGNAFADPLEEFSEAIHSIEEEFENIFEHLGDGFKEEESISLNEIKESIERIKAEAESIVALGEQNNRKDWAFEAEELVEVMDECLERLDEGEFDEAIHGLARAFHIVNLLQMVSPRFARNGLSEAYKDVQDLLARGDVRETGEAGEHIAEYMEGLARHTHYASKMYGKKVWRKFTEAALEAADELSDAFEDRDQAAAEAALKKLEKPIEMLEELIK